MFGQNVHFLEPSKQFSITDVAKSATHIHTRPGVTPNGLSKVATLNPNPKHQNPEMTTFSRKSQMQRS